jgi:sulfatase modifying factor 1
MKRVLCPAVFVLACAACAPTEPPASQTSVALLPAPAPLPDPAALPLPAPVAPAQARTPVEPTATDMIAIPAGPYWTGCELGEDPSCRARDGALLQLELPDYAIDRYEVTVADFRRCVQAGGCDASGMSGFADAADNFDWVYCNWSKEGKDDHPINCVSWKQASSYCGWADKRLPTEAEWEKAARGTDQRTYPWGDEMISCEYAVTNETGKPGDKGCGRDSTYPVGSKPKGASPYGVQDIVGNVWEWTADVYVAAPGVVEESHGKDHHVGKGGCWGSGNPWNSRISWSHHYSADYRSNVRLGFRCAKDNEG